MSNVFEINAQSRNDTGKGASRRLRREGLVPGIVYGANQDPAMISLVHTDLLQHLEHEAFFSHILDLKLDGKSEQVIMKGMQRHPAKPFINHVDFLRVSAREKLKTSVPLHFINEETAVGVKLGGVVSHHIAHLEVTCLPKDLPEFIDVDIAELDIGDIILLSGLTLPEGVEIQALIAGADDVPVVSVQHEQIMVEEEEEAEEEVAAGIEEAGLEEGAEGKAADEE